MKLNTIYPGFDGEVNIFGQGAPTIFIRLHGCNLCCNWCDTLQARNPLIGGKNVPPAQIISRLADYKGFKKVTITGGEPCLQKEELSLLIFELGRKGYRITVETNGSVEWHTIDETDDVDSWIVDYKLPSSGQMVRMLDYEYFDKYLGKTDYIKFPIADKEDFILAVGVQRLMMEKFRSNMTFAYSPIHTVISPALMADWIMQTPAIINQAVLNVQLHKLIGLP